MSRPRLRCGQCSHEWTPRGADMSRRCPACGIVFVEVRDRRGPSPLAQLVALAFIVVVVVVCWPSKKGQPAPDQPQQPADHNPKVAIPKETDPARIIPIASMPGEAPPTAVAPSPRIVDHSTPPATASYVTDWVRIGSIETRVTGVQVGPVPLRNRSTGANFPSALPALRIWVETRAVAGSGIGLRRWAAIDRANLSGTSGAVLQRSDIVSGYDVRGELYGTHQIVPGTEPIRDVLVFEVPAPTERAILLTLDAAHVGLSGDFRHSIPASAWK
jgi:hypothetical protein